MANNIFKPYKILETQLSSLPIVAGQIIFTTDTKRIYLDVDNNTRIYFEGKVSTKTVASATEPTNLSEGDIWAVIEK